MLHTAVTEAGRGIIHLRPVHSLVSVRGVIKWAMHISIWSFPSLYVLDPGLLEPIQRNEV